MINDNILETNKINERKMSPIMANSINDESKKEKFPDSSGNIISKLILMSNMKALTFIIKKL